MGHGFKTSSPTLSNRLVMTNKSDRQRRNPWPIAQRHKRGNVRVGVELSADMVQFDCNYALKQRPRPEPTDGLARSGVLRSVRAASDRIEPRRARSAAPYLM